MPFLSYAQRRAGRELGSRLRGRRLQADPAVHLPVRGAAGRARPNTAFGWCWADPIAALVIAAVAVKEGREAWRGDTCCAPPIAVSTRAPVAAELDGCHDGCCADNAADNEAGSIIARPVTLDPPGRRVAAPHRSTTQEAPHG